VCSGGVCAIQSCNAGWNDCYDGAANGCECSGQCVAGRCIETLASNRNDAVGLFVCGDDVYWAETAQIGGTAGIFSTQIGSGVVNQFATGQVNQITGDANNIYWANVSTNKIESTLRSNGTTTPLATVTPPAWSDVGATDGAFLYFYDGAGAFSKVPVGGGTVVKLATGQTAGGPIVVDAKNMYFGSGGLVRSVPKDPLQGTMITTYATIPNGDGAIEIVVDGSFVYWAEATNNRVMRAALAPPYTQTQLASYHAAGLALDGSNLYVTDYSNPTGKASSVSTSGGTVTDIATNQRNPDYVVVDATSVYWTEYATPGRVMRATPKLDPCPEGTACALDHATGVCTSGVCKIQTCDAGWKDCFGGDANGCECSGACNAGKCVETLASGRGVSGALFVGGSTVYWAESSGTGGIFSTQIGTGVVNQLAGTKGPTVFMSGDANNIYWANSNGPTPEYVEQTSRNPTATVNLASVQSSAYAGLPVADGTYVYYFDGTGSISKVPIGGGTVVPLATGQTGTGGVAALALDTNNVYWIYKGSVLSVPKDPAVGTTITTYATGGSGVSQLAVDSTHVYWTDGNQNTIMKAALASPHNPTQVISAHAYGIFLDGATIYFTDYSNPAGKVSKVAKTGGAVTDLATNQANPDFVVTDGTSAYWTEAAGSAHIMRITPK
jgi:hypothetical protein